MRMRTRTALIATLVILSPWFIGALIIATAHAQTAAPPGTMLQLQSTWESTVNPIIQSAAAAILTVLGGIALTWMRQHNIVGDDATANNQIKSGASNLAALMIATMKNKGLEPATLTLHSPELGPFAQELLGKFPDFSKRLGVNPQSAAQFVLTEAHKLLLTGPTALGGLAAIPAPTPAAAATTPLPADQSAAAAAGGAAGAIAGAATGAASGAAAGADVADGAATRTVPIA